MHDVQGWLDPFSARVIARLSQFQQEQGIRGATGEIGVHHGKLWLILHLTTRAEESCFAIDIFGEQEKNLDGSGRGDLDRFKANIRRYSGFSDNVVIWQTSSLEVSARDLIQRTGNVRLVSIDGGHTAECTANDLRIADQATIDAGVVILDDYFNPSWPDVSTGAAQYLMSGDATLRPFAITPNKLMLARPPFHGLYRGALERAYRHTAYYDKKTVMFAHSVDVYGNDVRDAGRLGRLGVASRRAYWAWRSKHSKASA